MLPLDSTESTDWNFCISSIQTLINWCILTWMNTAFDVELLVVAVLQASMCLTGWDVTQKANSTCWKTFENDLATNTFNPSDAKRKEMHAHHSLHAYYCSMLQQSWKNQQPLTQTGDRSRGDTWRLDGVDILLLLKKHQSGYCRQRLACSNVHNNGNHSRVWTWGLVFFHLGKVGRFGTLKQNECWTICTGTGKQKTDACLHAMWTQRTFNPASQCWGLHNPHSLSLCIRTNSYTFVSKINPHSCQCIGKKKKLPPCRFPLYAVW